MLVDRPKADVAAAGHRDLRSLVLAEQCANHIIGPSDAADVLIVHRQILDPGAIDDICMPIRMLNVRADALDRLNKHADITDIRNILYSNGLVRHDRSCQNAKRRIFRAGDLNFT